MLEILYEDTHLLVLEKPAGLLSQGDKSGDQSLVDWCREYLGRNYVGLIHRLDRGTSGAILVGKRSKASRRLTEALLSGKICRVYQAWVAGHFPKKVNWTHFITKDKEKNISKIVSPNIVGAKTATLSGTLVRSGSFQNSDISLVEFILETGRSHQIRVQCAHEGFPLLGDSKYGNGPLWNLSRPALHSKKLSFPHPMTDETIEVESPLPIDMSF